MKNSKYSKKAKSFLDGLQQYKDGGMQIPLPEYQMAGLAGPNGQPIDLINYAPVFPSLPLVGQQAPVQPLQPLQQLQPRTPVASLQPLPSLPLNPVQSINQQQSKLPDITVKDPTPKPNFNAIPVIGSAIALGLGVKEGIEAYQAKQRADRLKGYYDQDLAERKRDISLGEYVNTPYTQYQDGGIQLGETVSKFRASDSSQSGTTTGATKMEQAKLSAAQQKENQRILAERKARMERSKAAKGKPLSAQQIADESAAIGDKFRFFPDDPNSVIDALNPAVLVGDLASGLGQVPLNIQEGNYGQAAMNVAAPLVTGALLGGKNAAQLANNLVNPLAGIDIGKTPSFAISNMPKTVEELANTGFKTSPYYHLANFTNKQTEIGIALETPKGIKRLQGYIDNNPHLKDTTVDEIINNFKKTNFEIKSPRYDEDIKDWIRDRYGNKKYFDVDPNNAYNWFRDGFNNPSYVAIGQNYSPYDAMHILEHEFAHLFQRGNEIKGVDDVLSSITLKDDKDLGTEIPRSFLSQYNPFAKKVKDVGYSATGDIYGTGQNVKHKAYWLKKAKDYWETGNKRGMEKAAFSAEVRENLLQRGILKNRYDKITPKMLEKHFNLYHNTTGDKYNLRLYDIMKKDKNNFKILSETLNKMPALLPAAGAGYLGYEELPKAKEGGIHIDPKNKGKFTAAAKRRGMGVQEFANKVMANKEDYSPLLVKRANFAKNAAKWEDGGMYSSVSSDQNTTVELANQRKEQAMDLLQKMEEVAQLHKMMYGGEIEKFGNGGEMIKRADGSYSRVGLWDRIRENKGSGKKPTKEMLKQERKIRKEEMEYGGYMPFMDAMDENNQYMDLPEFGNGGYKVERSNDRKGKTHKVTGPDGSVKYFGDPKMGERSKSKYGKEAFYARHKSNLEKNPHFRAYARATWQNGGQIGLEGFGQMYDNQQAFNQNTQRQFEEYYNNLNQQNVANWKNMKASSINNIVSGIGGLASAGLGMPTMQEGGAYDPTLDVNSPQFDANAFLGRKEGEGTELDRMMQEQAQIASTMDYSDILAEFILEGEDRGASAANLDFMQKYSQAENVIDPSSGNIVPSKGMLAGFDNINMRDLEAKANAANANRVASQISAQSQNYDFTPNEGSKKFNNVIDEIKFRESRGKYGVVNEISQTTGAYQFMPKYWAEDIRKFMGIDPSASQKQVMEAFRTNPQAQDAFMAHVVDTKYKPQLPKLRPYAQKYGINDDQLIKLMHYRGIGDATKRLKTGNFAVSAEEKAKYKNPDIMEYLKGPVPK